MMKKKSFTVVEVLIAIFILEVAILGVASFYASSLRTTRIARNETIASNLAAGLLDEEIANTYDNLGIIDGSKTRYSETSGDPFYDWYKEVDVTYIDSNLGESTTETNMKKIVVTIYWTQGSTQKSFQTATIKARH